MKRVRVKSSSKKRSIWKDTGNLQLLLLCVPALILYILFHYVPLASGIVLPFKNYSYREGIFGSEWCGLDNFEFLLRTTAIPRALKNTVFYSVLFAVVDPIVNVLFALLLFEVVSKKLLKLYLISILSI